MKMHVGTGWIDKPESINVINPFDGSVVDTVPKSDLKDVETAIATARHGAKIMAQLTAYDRYRLLSGRRAFGRTVGRVCPDDYAGRRQNTSRVTI
jgi:acyl-CoA reductase-like NAD-dependent aldehyde dehydrogenase